MLYKLLIYGTPSTKQACYQPVIKFTYWPVLGSYKNCDIVELTPKSIPFEEFDEMHKVVLDGISYKMASLGKSVMFGAINKVDTIKMDYL